MNLASKLMSPLCLVATAAMIGNDRWLKHAYPGVLSGKLSDFCGVLLLPLWLSAGVELTLVAVLRRRPPGWVEAAVVNVAIAVTAVVFSAIQLSPMANRIYASGLGLVQWPFRGAFALLQGHGPVPWAPVASVSDPSDLIALVMLPIVWWMARRPGHRSCNSTAAVMP